MKIRWRTGLSGATAAERLNLLELEYLARRRAIELDCAERCAEHSIGMADCSDIRVSSSRLGWGRHSGYLYVVCAVTLAPSSRVRSLKYRVPAPKRKPKGRVVPGQLTLDSRAKDA